MKRQNQMEHARRNINRFYGKRQPTAAENIQYISKRKAIEWPSFEDACEEVLKLKIKTYKEYGKRYKEASIRLPCDPPKVYWRKWVSWPHFLRGAKKPKKKYRGHCPTEDYLYV